MVWSNTPRFVEKKLVKLWRWLALDRKTKEVIGVFVGDRSRESARELWKVLLAVYRSGCCSTPNVQLFIQINGEHIRVFRKRHRIVNKGSGETNHIERFNNTLRQRVSRLGRKTLAFSKKLINHLGEILCFIDYYLSNL